MINIAELINNPERMDRDTLYELRAMLALHPYYQTIRLLMLQNLYLLHDPSFDEELRRSAVYITDRRTLFNVVEGAHYRWNHEAKPVETAPDGDRTIALIDTFLGSIPSEDPEAEKKKRRPTPADATVDYVAYLLESEDEEEQTENELPKMQGQSLIDNFLEKEQGRFALGDMRDNIADEEDNGEGNSQQAAQPANAKPEAEQSSDNEEEFFTETLARIYIKQGRYQKALAIIQRLSTQFPGKNAYFADQIRFLEKLIINSNKNKK